jgi:hypothetical protein
LGHEINAQGIHPLPLQEKVDAITKSQPPKDADQLHTVIGIVNYYHKFISNISSILNSLHQLSRKNAQFVCTKNCDAAIQSIKADLASSRVLVHYDPKVQLILATVASPYARWVGCALITHNAQQFRKADRLCFLLTYKE